MCICKGRDRLLSVTKPGLGVLGCLAEGGRLVSGAQSLGMGSTYLFVKGLIEVCKRKIEPFIVNGSVFRKLQLEQSRCALYRYRK
jgi:hypothetical protein